MKETNPIVAARHASYATPSAIVSDIVREATGQEGVNVVKIAQGYGNEVYRATLDLPSSESVFVRIRRYGDTPFSQEVWAIAQARTTGVPVTDVLLLTTRVLDNAPREVMVQRALAGRPADVLWPSLSPSDRTHICAQAGAALRRLHSIKVGGFYRRHDDETWDFPDWDAIAASARRDRAAEAPALHRAGFDDGEISRLLAILDASLAELSAVPPVLCHGDFKPAHWFFDDALLLTGIIDFGDFQGGSALLDFARLSLYAPDVNLTDVLAGYGEPDEGREEWERRLRRFTVGQAIGYLAHVMGEGDTAGAEYFTRRLRELLTERAAG